MKPQKPGEPALAASPRLPKTLSFPASFHMPASISPAPPGFGNGNGLGVQPGETHGLWGGGRAWAFSPASL